MSRLIRIHNRVSYSSFKSDGIYMAINKNQVWNYYHYNHETYAYEFTKEDKFTEFILFRMRDVVVIQQVTLDC